MNYYRFINDCTRLFCLFALASVFITACGTMQKEPRFEESETHFSHKDLPNQSSPNQNSVGKASWYGREFHKHRTASGERYNMFDFTAAHRTLPFGSKIRVRNLRSGKTVLVRVNDRGPVNRSRLIDLSYAAGKALGILHTGIAKVQIEIVRP